MIAYTIATGWVISLQVPWQYQSKGAQGIFPCCDLLRLISTNKPGTSSLTIPAQCCQNYPHWTLPWVLSTRATSVAPKPSLFYMGSTTLLPPGLLGMLSGCKDMDSCLLTSKTLTDAPKEGAEVLWSAIWRYWSLLLDWGSLTPAQLALPWD